MKQFDSLHIGPQSFQISNKVKICQPPTHFIQLIEMGKFQPCKHRLNID